MIYGADAIWWRLRKGLPNLDGIKLCATEHPCREYRDVHRVFVDTKTDKILTEKPGTVGRGGQAGFGGNSGFQAANLAAQLRPRRIVFVGIDMRLDLGVHWHGRNPAPQNNPNDINITNWRHAFEAAAPQFAALGIEVLNASPISALTSYRKAEFRECLA